MKWYIKRALWFAPFTVALLLYNIYVIRDYNAASDSLRNFSDAIGELRAMETHLSFEASGAHDIWLLLPRGTSVEQTVQIRDETKRAMSVLLAGKKVDFSVMDGNVPESSYGGEASKLTYLARFDADGEAQLIVKGLNRDLVPKGTKLVVESSPASSDGDAYHVWIASALRNHLGMTDAVAVLALVIIGIVVINRPRT